MSDRIKTFFLIFLLISGCAPIPKKETATMISSFDCNSVVADAFEGGDFIRGDWPNREWWKTLQDPFLTWLIEAALRANPTLKRAEARFRSATQVALQQRAALFPEVDFDASTDWEHLAKDGFFRAFAPQIPAVVNDINLDFTFSFEIDFWGKYRSIYYAALGEAAAAAAEKMQAELMLTTSIAYTYTQLQFLLRKQQILEQSVCNEERIVQIRTKRQKYALDSSFEPLNARSDTLDVQSDLLETKQQILEEYHRLKALTALGQDFELELHYYPLNPAVLSLPENLPLDLVGRRPDLIAQRKRVEAAGKLIHAAKTDFYPNVNLMATLGLESVFWSTLFRKRNYSGSLEPAIHLPIFTAGRLSAQYREKIALFDEAVFTYNELILNVAQEVADRLTDISLLEQRIKVRREYLQTARIEWELSQRRLQHALDDQARLLEMSNAVLERELILAQLEYSKQLASVLLIRTLGGGFHD
jgi:NodT family efflux transporter outer membrane factor (OMF) lipoprotein